MARLRIAFFGSASRYSERALHALTEAHEVVAVVTPSRGSRLRTAVLQLAGLAKPSGLEHAAAAQGIPHCEAGDGDALREVLARARPDLVAIALFPQRLPEELIALAPLGAVNVHPSLLPRHRGPLPLFWTYHADDRTAGVTVHRATNRLDAGDILACDAFPLARGFPAAALDAEVGQRAGPLLRRAVDALAHGDARSAPQDESAATYAPYVEPGNPMVDFVAWDAERVWHFLSALAPRYREPLRDDRGRAVDYASVLSWSARAEGEPGQVRSLGNDGWLLNCRGGSLHLARAADPGRLVDSP